MMQKKQFVFLVFCMTFLSMLCSFANPQLRYIENQGQWHEDVLYKASIRGASIFVEEEGFTFSYYNANQLEEFMGHCGHDSDPSDEETYECAVEDVVDLPHTHQDAVLDLHAIKLRFVDGNTPSAITATELLTEQYSYFKGNDPSKWAGNIHPSKRLLFEDVYDGVDMEVYSNGSNFKYDFLVEAHANTANILLEYQGTEGMCIKEGELFLSTSVNEVVELAPYAYQQINGVNVTVDCQFELVGDNQVRFILGEDYDSAYPLVIDPELAASTYSGATTTVYGHVATYGADAELIAAGRVFSGGTFPTTPGAFQETVSGGGVDIGINKYSADGSTLLLSTLLGGNGSDLVANMIENNSGELVVFSSIQSSDFPVTVDAYDDAYNGGGQDMGLTVLANDFGSLVGSTYLGGSGDEIQIFSQEFPGLTLGFNGYRLRGEVMVDDQDNIYVASSTASSDFPITDNAFQSFYSGGSEGVVAKLNSNLSDLLWSTYLGGISEDAAFAIRVASDYSVFVAGATDGGTFPTTPGALNFMPPSFESTNGFLTHLNADGSNMVESTFVGTEDDDALYFVEINDNDEPYVYGITAGNFPITDGAFGNEDGDIFIAKITADLSDYEFTTTFGDNSDANSFGGAANPTAFTIDDCGRVFGGCFTPIDGLPVTDDAYEPDGSGDVDFYLFVLEDGADNLAYGTYVGAGEGSHVDGGTSRYDSRGTVYQAVCTSSSNFPTTTDAFSTDDNGSWDLMAFKFEFASIDMEVVVEPALLDSVNCIFNATLVVLGDEDTYEVTVNPGGEVINVNNGDSFEVTLDALVAPEYTATVLGNEGCQALITLISPECIILDPCMPEPAVLTTDAPIICSPDSVVASVSGGFLEDEQMTWYVLHTVSDTTLGTVFETNQTGVFFYPENGGSYYTEYYITAIGSYPDENGNPILDDECTVYSNNESVLYLEPLSWEIDEQCDFTVGDYYVTASPQGGYPQYDPTATYQIFGDFVGSLSYGESVNLYFPEGSGVNSFFLSISNDSFNCKPIFVNSEEFYCEKTPIELLRFEGIATEQGNEITWITASEADNDFFTVEYSADGNSFENIATINGSGTTFSTNQYAFTHKAPDCGLGYYRLSWTSFNGVVEYASNVVKINRTELGNATLDIAPVPAINQVNLTFSSTIANATAQISIYDVSGRLVQTNQVNTNTCMNRTSLPVNTLSPGLYLLRIDNGVEAVSRQFVKQ
ncbi:MAG: T9SS type A sorting domain-containing protein [Chitinophagales bacterium]